MNIACLQVREKFVRVLKTFTKEGKKVECKKSNTFSINKLYLVKQLKSLYR